MMLQEFRNNHTGEVVEAAQVTTETVDFIEAWTDGVKVEEINPFDHEVVYPAVNVPTNSGNRRASEGAWVVKGPVGLFYIFRPSEFSHSFQEA